MDHPPAGSRDLVDRPRVQPPGRRAARRVRPAGLALALFLAACGGAPEEDFEARFLAADWESVPDGWRTSDLVAGLRRYAERDGPVYPRDDARVKALIAFLARARPDPASLAPLLVRDEHEAIEAATLRGDLIGFAVVSSWGLRLRRGDDSHAVKLYEGLAEAIVRFGFDARYGDSATGTGQEAFSLLSDGTLPPTPVSRAGLQARLPAMLAAWRDRVTSRASSTFFGIVLFHLGSPGAEALFAEWDGLDPDERYDLLRRIADEEESGTIARRTMVQALLDPSIDVRDAALDALAAHGAPVDGLASPPPDDRVAAALPALRRWVAETES